MMHHTSDSLSSLSLNTYGSKVKAKVNDFCYRHTHTDQKLYAPKIQFRGHKNICLNKLNMQGLHQNKFPRRVGTGVQNMLGYLDVQMCKLPRRVGTGV